MIHYLINLTTKFGAQGDACDPGGGGFLGLKTWYAYLEGTEDAFGKCIPTLGTPGGGVSDIDIGNIWLIALALIDSALRIAALVAIAFVIYGGFEMILSNGNPEQVNKARNTIINAVVGLVIAILATAIIAFLANQLGV